MHTQAAAILFPSAGVHIRHQSERLNERHGFFKEIIPLPHPRWVMQYRRRRLQEFIALYVEKLRLAVSVSGRPGVRSPS